MPHKPLCFVLMPFGRKADETGRSIDFDAVYREIIAKAVAFAEMEPIRADEEQVGGTIHKPMFERLLLCDFAIADLTGANANVFYELGIRHAIRPRSTLLIACEGTRRPFDVAPLRTWHYRVDAEGKPEGTEETAARIGEQLGNVASTDAEDSPWFEMMKHDFELPRIHVARAKTDDFREHLAHSKAFKVRLDAAVREGREAVAKLAAEGEFKELRRVDADTVLNLYLAHRAVEDFAGMAALYRRMPKHLQQTVMVREQYAFALNRIGRRDDAEHELRELVERYGPSSENLGLLGRIYKDRWREAKKLGDEALAGGYLDEALETYVKGFEADWRDTYPGVNALTLFEMLEDPDPRREEILPVVEYAALRRSRRANADYWDWATLLEIAILKGDQAGARRLLRTALVKARVQKEAFAPRSTAGNLNDIREKRAAIGDDVSWIANIQDELIKCADALAEGEKKRAEASG
jgi:hypothetical protein